MDIIHHIEKISKGSPRLEHTIQYALYSTLSYTEILSLLKENYLNIEIRDKLLTQVERRFQDEDCHDLIDYLIPLFNKGHGNIKRSIGKYFTVLDSKLNLTQRENIYRISIFSSMPSIRKKAYEQVEKIYKEITVTNDLITNWELYHDINVIMILMKIKEYEYIYINYEIIWNDNNISIKLKHQITNKIASYNKGILPIVKELDKISFLSACYHAKDTSFLPDLKDIISSSKTLAQLSYCIWILGQFGLYDEITNLIPLINKVEKLLPKTILELQNEMLSGYEYYDNSDDFSSEDIPFP